MPKLDEITITLAIATAIKADFNGIDIWDLCQGMEIHEITAYRVVFVIGPPQKGQYDRAIKFVDIHLKDGKLTAQSQTRHSISVDYSNPESMKELYEFIRKECFMKRPSRLSEYAVWKD